MEFSENFASEAGELMDSILADTDLNPSIIPQMDLGGGEPAHDLFEALDDGAPSLDRMKRAGLHHDEAFEL